MNISRLVEKIFIRSFLIVILSLLQACSNTVIGEKLENSFEISEEKNINKSQKLSEKLKIKSRISDDKNESVAVDFKANSISNKDRFIQKSTKSTKKKTIFNPQPYRIIIRLSGANPSAPAETVTEALRKAGVQFEVEKIERFDVEKLSNNRSLKR